MAIKSEIYHSLPEFATECPSQIRQLAIKDACTAVKNAKAKFVKTNEFQEVKFRSRKDRKQTVKFIASAVSSKGVYHTMLGELAMTEQLPEVIRDSSLTLFRGQYYLCVSTEVPRVQSDNQARPVALDPGVRSFLTFFSPWSVGKIGNGDFSRITRLCQHLDKLVSKLSKATGRSKRNMRKASDRLRSRITHLIDELHWKTCNFLTSQFDVIFLPTFDTSQMALKASRRIRSKTVRSMLTFSHYKFEQRLSHKCFERGKTLLIVNEAYTSKTISWTGEMINNLGGRKTITSPASGETMDRDYNGARGIFLRALVDTPSLSLECA